MNLTDASKSISWLLTEYAVKFERKNPYIIGTLFPFNKDHAGPFLPELRILEITGERNSSFEISSLSQLLYNFRKSSEYGFTYKVKFVIEDIGFCKQSSEHYYDVWYRQNTRDRFNEPALIETCTCGCRYIETWYTNGQINRFDGPAIIRKNDGRTTSYWFVRDQFLENFDESVLKNTEKLLNHVRQHPSQVQGILSLCEKNGMFDTNTLDKMQLLLDAA